jgi:hypothetical protein
VRGGELVAEVVVGWVEAIAETHQSHLGLPILRELMEVQDNNGAVNDGVVDANVTFNRLISAIQAAGGPGYQFRSIIRSMTRTAVNPGAISAWASCSTRHG